MAWRSALRPGRNRGRPQLQPSRLASAGCGRSRSSRSTVTGSSPTGRASCRMVEPEVEYHALEARCPPDPNPEIKRARVSRRYPGPPSLEMSSNRSGPRRVSRQRITGTAGWLAEGGLLFVAALWASEPGGATRPPRPGTREAQLPRGTGASLELLDAVGVYRKGLSPRRPRSQVHRWSQDGSEWKPCGSEIRPPDPGRINSCGIGQAGGHEPHGDDLDVKYTYLGKHEDRTGPTYAVCDGDPDLPADTSPNNCGTWVITPHDHCSGDDDAHPPDCPSSTPSRPPTRVRLRPRARPSSPGRRPPPVPPTTVSDDPWACYEPETYEALDDTMDDQRARRAGAAAGRARLRRCPHGGLLHRRYQRCLHGPGRI